MEEEEGSAEQRPHQSRGSQLGPRIVRVGFPIASPGTSERKHTAPPPSPSAGMALPLGDQSAMGRRWLRGVTRSRGGQRVRKRGSGLGQGQSEPAAHRPGECRLGLRWALPEAVGEGRPGHVTKCRCG